MPKTWLYYIALILPLVFGILVVHTGFVEWVWYQGHEEHYYLLSSLRQQPRFVEFLAGWPLAVFVVTICAYWTMDESSDAIPGQFLLAPILYLPFTILGDVILTGDFKGSNLFAHPLIIIPIGYVYVLTWAVFVRVLEKLGLVL